MEIKSKVIKLKFDFWTGTLFIKGKKATTNALKSENFIIYE